MPSMVWVAPALIWPSTRADGVEGFIGRVGLRLEVGDEIYLNNGTFNNLRVTFGPHIRF